MKGHYLYYKFQNLKKFFRLNFYHSYYRNYVFLNFKFIKKKWTREVILKHLNKMGIECDVGSCPEIYREKIFKKLKLYPKKRLINAKLLGETSIMFPINPNASIKKVKLEVNSIKKILNKYI